MKAITGNGINITLNDNAELNRGGEGRILLIPEMPGMVAKIYLTGQQAITKAQLQALLVLDHRLFVTPRELIYDKPNGAVLGFTMPLLPSDFVPLNALFSEPFCRKHNITRQRKMNIALQIAQAVNHAHEQQVVIGDLSALNVMVNGLDEVKFIDVDSYGTSAKPHSGTVLNEIRDYYYGGLVNRQSDYFALAVLLFQLLTYAHPFKGIHPHCSTLKERMIRQIPIFAPDKQLIAPKCYRPITDNNLQNQFIAMFMNAVRTPIQLHLPASTTLHTAPAVAPVRALLPDGALETKTIYQPLPGEHIEEVFCLHSRLLITTNRQFLLYDMYNKGSTALTMAFPRTIAQRLFIGNQVLLAEKNNCLFLLDKNGSLMPVQNVTLQPNYRFAQFDNLLAVAEDQLLKTINLNAVNNANLQTIQTPVFGNGISVKNGAMWQNTGGRLFVFYPSGQYLSSAYCNYMLHDVYLRGNQGMLTWQSSNGNGETTLRATYFGIHNLQLHLTAELPDTSFVKKFAYRATNKQHGIIFEPADNQLLIRRSEDGAILQKVLCPDMTDQDELHLTGAGLVCLSASGQLNLLNMNS